MANDTQSRQVLGGILKYAEVVNQQEVAMTDTQSLARRIAAEQVGKRKWELMYNEHNEVIGVKIEETMTREEAARRYPELFQLPELKK